MAAAPVSPVQSSAAGKRKEPSEVEQDEPSPAQVVAKKAKSVDEIDQEVRELLDKKLFGQDDAVKVEALRKLSGYTFHQEYRSEDPDKKLYRRAVVEWGGCRLVLLVLELELDKRDRANRDLVHGAIRFLLYWNYRSEERRDMMMRFKGVGIVARAMHVFPVDSGIQHVGIATFLNFTEETGKTQRLEELAKGNCIPLILRVMTTRTNAEETRKYAVVVLGRLCDVAGPASFEGHVDASALGALHRWEHYMTRTELTRTPTIDSPKKFVHRAVHCQARFLISWK